jgi:glycerol uptake facilitator-like aquaporin
MQVCSGNCGLGQAIANVLAQLAGATLGSLLLWGTTSMRGSGLGANAVDPQFSRGNAVLGEIVMTLVLVRIRPLWVVWVSAPERPAWK